MEILIRNKVIEAIKVLYGQIVDEKQVQVQTTRKEFAGDKTVMVFPFLRFSKKTAEQTAEEILNGHWQSDDRTGRRLDSCL